uniref:Uncharacterized protein n=1 Tax=Odontella aurita TaxID=265563 RepID=A0A6U6CRA1_9STRA|mmetsp:Transcript_15240/g.44219  ORF Transcript_15240/g.44219 Transcript_15240/m.44219 type:complete len:147 (+) Transcript_15240:729-1169(+)
MVSTRKDDETVQASAGDLALKRKAKHMERTSVPKNKTLKTMKQKLPCAEHAKVSGGGSAPKGTRMLVTLEKTKLRFGSPSETVTNPRTHKTCVDIWFNRPEKSGKFCPLEARTKELKTAFKEFQEGKPCVVLEKLRATHSDTRVEK